MQRTVEPEILDSLPAADPRALASRRDLRLYNRLMANFRWFSMNLSKYGNGYPILEIGAGDGGLGLYLRRRHHSGGISRYTGLDLTAKPPSWPSDWEWKQENLLDHEFTGASGILLANLVLHHFEEGALKTIGERIDRSSFQLLLLNEPTRRRFHLWQVTASRLLGIHPVTLHDAKGSVRAGFRGDQLARFLGLDATAWVIRTEENIMGANRLVCRRKP